METVISIYDLFKLYQKDNSIKILDVRTRDKFNEYHINNSINMPGYSLLKAHNKLIDENKLYYIIDYDNELANEISANLNSLGYNTIYVFGGIKHWKGNFS